MAVWPEAEVQRYDRWCAISLSLLEYTWKVNVEANHGEDIYRGLQNLVNRARLALVQKRADTFEGFGLIISKVK